MLYNDDRAILRNITKTFSEGKALAVVDEEQIIANAQADAEALGLVMDSEDLEVEVAIEVRDGVLQRVLVFRPDGDVEIEGPLEEVVLDIP